MRYKKELIEILANDALIMETLTIVRELKLNDCWVGAGLIRNTVWDSLHQIKTTKRNDIDVVFFDVTTRSETLEKEIEKQLNQINPEAKWSVKNQARMHFPTLPPNPFVWYMLLRPIFDINSKILAFELIGDVFPECMMFYKTNHIK